MINNCLPHKEYYHICIHIASVFLFKCSIEHLVRYLIKFFLISFLTSNLAISGLIVPSLAVSSLVIHKFFRPKILFLEKFSYKSLHYHLYIGLFLVYYYSLCGFLPIKVSKIRLPIGITYYPNINFCI